MKNKLNHIMLVILILFTQVIYAQTTNTAIASTPSSTYNVLRYTLLAIAIILMVLIIALSYIINNVASYYLDNWKKEKNNTQTNVITSTIILLFIGNTTANAQSMPSSELTFGIDLANMPVDIYMLAFGVLVEIIILYGLIDGIFKLLKKVERETITDAAKKPEKTFFETINSTVAIEDEYLLDLSHDYDGIRELDNKVPGWWRIGFYASILFAFVYLFKFFGDKSIKSQYVELNDENIAAEVQKTEYLKLAANNVDENSVKLSDALGIDAGKTLYMANCVACHGAGGQGSVGPNLTDDYWLHKGGLKDIFYSIKYGYAEKGMKSWKDDFSPAQIAEISSFVTTLKGTNPPNPKEKQGELYKEEPILMKDSIVATNVDTLKTK